MYWRLALGGVAWVGVLILFVAGLQDSAAPSRMSAPIGSSALVRSLNQPQADAGRRWWSWRVTRATPAHRMLIVEVEAERVSDAKAIAAQVVAPVRTHGYEEILIYVRRPGAPLADRRVQWTPERGYVELIMTE